MTCKLCSGSYFIEGAEDTWIPCECLKMKRLRDLMLGDKFDEQFDVSQYLGKDLLLTGQQETMQKFANSLIWALVQIDQEPLVRLAYSGDMAGEFLSNDRSKSFVSGYVNFDLLFVNLITGEAYGKLTGVVVNQVLEVRKTEGLRTYFFTPYVGTKLFQRYPGDESPFGDVLRNMEIVRTDELFGG